MPVRGGKPARSEPVLLAYTCGYRSGVVMRGTYRGFNLCSARENTRHGDNLVHVTLTRVEDGWRLPDLVFDPHISVREGFRNAESLVDAYMEHHQNARNQRASSELT